MKKLCYCISALLLPFLTWSSSGFEWSAWKLGHCSHFHRTFPSMVSPVNCHPSFRWNLMLFLGNLYPWWGRRCWHRFHWAARWGRYILPILDMHLGMRVRRGLHLHLSRFRHMLWTAPRYCIQLEIQVHCARHWSGIWNDLRVMFEFEVMSKLFFSLQPHLVLARLDWSRDLTAT